MRAPGLLLIVALAAYGDSGYGVFSALTGPADCMAIAGNGMLTVGVNETGTLTVLRWPGTTAPNQVSHANTPQSHAGGMWGIARDGRIDWLPRASKVVHVTSADGPAPIITISYDGAGVTETVLVLPEQNLAIFRLDCSSIPPGARVVWFSDFSPCTKPMPGFPSSERYIEARHDLVTFVENGVVYHARPSDAGSKYWGEAQAWLDGGAVPDWLKKSDGVWIAYSSDGDLAGALCGGETGERDALHLAQSGEWDGHFRAIGPAASAAVVPIDAAHRSATIYVALGEHRKDVDDALAKIRKKSFGTLLEETQEWWQKRLDDLTPPNTLPQDGLTLYRRALRQLLVNVDRETGAAARAPLSTPPFAVDIPRLGVWATTALDRAGAAGVVRQRLAFYAQAVRKSDTPGAPAGSMPAALFGSGEDAALPLVLDVQAPAWLLWSIWQHDSRVTGPDRKTYREEMWRPVELMGDFLANWGRAVRDTPAFSFAPARLSDMASLDTIAVVRAGLRAAETFARAAGREKPEWDARAQELDDYLRFNTLNLDGSFKVRDPLSLWMADIAGAGDAHWEGVVRQTIDTLRDNPKPDTLPRLAMLVMLLRDQKEKRAEVWPIAPPVIRASLDAYPCDSYYAALAVVVLLGLQG